MTEHWVTWAELQRGIPKVELARRLWLGRGLKSLQLAVLIQIALFVDSCAEPCWWTDRQLAEKIHDGNGRHPCTSSVRRARRTLEDMGVLKCERLKPNSTRLGPIRDDGLITNPKEWAQACGTTLKTINWDALGEVRA